MTGIQHSFEHRLQISPNEHSQTGGIVARTGQNSV